MEYKIFRASWFQQCEGEAEGKQTHLSLLWKMYFCFPRLEKEEEEEDGGGV